MSNLRKLVQTLILEIYELSPEDKERRERMGSDKDYIEQVGRITGVQKPEEQRSDIDLLKKYQKKLQSTPEGKELIRAYMSGNGVTTFHAINYISYAMETDQKRWDRPEFGFSGWIKKYGKQGRDNLSCLSHIGAPGDVDPNNIKENEQVLDEGYGFLMKGYPKLVSAGDVSSQTLGSLPDYVEDHWKDSGKVKRASASQEPGFIYSLEELKNSPKGASGETILDNWGIIGCYINYTANTMGSYGHEYAFEYMLDLHKDAEKLGFKPHIYHWEKGHLGQPSYEEFAKMLEDEGMRGTRLSNLGRKPVSIVERSLVREFYGGDWPGAEFGFKQNDGYGPRNADKWEHRGKTSYVGKSGPTPDAFEEATKQYPNKKMMEDMCQDPNWELRKKRVLLHKDVTESNILYRMRWIEDPECPIEVEIKLNYYMTDYEVGKEVYFDTIMASPDNVDHRGRYVREFNDECEGKGNGTRCIRSIQDYAVKHGAIVTLVPYAFAPDKGGKRMSTHSLARWYRRLGFKDADGAGHFYNDMGTLDWNA